MDLMDFSEKRNAVEHEIRKLLNDLSAEYGVNLDVKIESVETTAIGDETKKYFSSVIVRGVV